MTARTLHSVTTRAGLIVVAGLMLAACGHSRSDRTLTGGAIGAGTGAVIGAAAVGTPGAALAGAAIGGVAGAAIGHSTSPRRSGLRCWINRYGEEVCRVR